MSMGPLLSRENKIGKNLKLNFLQPAAKKSLTRLDFKFHFRFLSNFVENLIEAKVKFFCN